MKPDINILVVDDSRTQQHNIVALCQDNGVGQYCTISHIEVAENGVIALEKLRATHFHLVFVDLEMPVMDGIELVRVIAKDKLADAIIILSGKDPSLIVSIGTMAESDGLTVVGTFQKPLSADNLISSLKRLASNANKENGKEQQKVYNRLSADHILEGINKQQITLYYQPKLTCQGLLLKGVEALARWPHPKFGDISPFEFITAAEEFGVISTLTHYLFDIALKQKQQWQQQEINFHLAFNLSPLSLADEGLVDKIANQVENYALQPKDIILEITENAISGEVSKAIATLAKLRLKGFNLAIDDYGTGFANAQQLSRVPATELKLDRVLVNNVTTNPQQRAILKSTVILAKELGLKTVAEGIEHLEDFKYIHQIDVDLLQGFYFAKPMAAHKIKHWLQKELPLIRKELKLTCN
ncbi:MAG: EAL domain-containing response regulator [Colwellia sp.]|nr:EAL domain-containing response regulator [Colwellia sp.]